MALTIPKMKRPRLLNPHRLVGVVYGSEGVGKSTFASGFKDPLFIALEPGLAGLEAYEAEIDGQPIVHWSWSLFREWVDLLTSEGAHQFGTVVVDTLDRLTALAVDETCRKYRVPELSGSPKSAVYWSHVKVMLTVALEQLTSAGFGVIFIAHEKTETIEASTGRVVGMMERPQGETFQRFVPSGGSAYRAIAARADYILRAAVDLRSGRRVLECSPSATRIAKDRSGVLPEVLPLDYAAFLECFRSAYKADNSGDPDNEEQSTA